MAKTISDSNVTGAGQEAIARRAYEIWESEGRPEGRAMDHWLRAVSELKARNDRQADLKSDRTARETAPTKPRSQRRFQTTQ